MSETPTAPAQSAHLLSYVLINREVELMVTVLLNKLGTPVRLSYRKGDEELGFQSGDLTSATTDNGLRISVSLDIDGTPERSFSFELLLPVVALGPDSLDKGPVYVFAAGLRIEHFPNASSGPRQAIEAYPLPGAALALAD
jgi:hypothetical protein